MYDYRGNLIVLCRMEYQQNGEKASIPIPYLLLLSLKRESCEMNVIKQLLSLNAWGAAQQTRAMPLLLLEQHQRPGEQPGRPEEQLFGPTEPLYISGEQLNRPQNDSGTRGPGTDIWEWLPMPSES
ncbi:hypothetical protein MKW98_003873 [Papaver atlanticum]|uniref:Uncharacterized protein n=1 Tax=Papaver atlanticum TaxID=357466 RepID=A0AAD4SLE9_9MAGN|nr:hypothetical protein MKW98_003873 [Papaver atlanticum]